MAKGGDGVRVVVAELESGGGLRGPGGEQPHRLRRRRLHRRRAGDQLGEGERGHAPGHLAGNAERLATGRQHGQVRAAAEQGLGEVGDRLDQVLAVVEQEQLLAVADVSGEGDLRRPVGGEPGVQGLGDRRADQLGLAERRQLDRPDPVGEILRLLPRKLQRQPGLAAAAGPGQGEEPRVAQQRRGLGQLALAADEAGQL